MNARVTPSMAGDSDRMALSGSRRHRNRCFEAVSKCKSSGCPLCNTALTRASRAPSGSSAAARESGAPMSPWVMPSNKPASGVKKRNVRRGQRQTIGMSILDRMRRRSAYFDCWRSRAFCNRSFRARSATFRTRFVAGSGASALRQSRDPGSTPARIVDCRRLAEGTEMICPSAMRRSFNRWGWQDAQHRFTLQAMQSAALPQISARPGFNQKEGHR